MRVENNFFIKALLKIKSFFFINNFHLKEKQNFLFQIKKVGREREREKYQIDLLLNNNYC